MTPSNANIFSATNRAAFGEISGENVRFSTYCLTIYLTYNSCLMVRVLAVNERADISRDH